MVKHVFVDESGDESLEVNSQNISSFQVVCAVIIDSNELDGATRSFDAARKKFFRGDEMKSSAVDNPHRRSLILQELLAAPFKIHALVVNKAMLQSPGLRYPASFTKHVHRKLYGELEKDYAEIKIVCDNVKNQAFMEELKRYLNKHFDFAGLFSKLEFQYVDSKDEVCVQAADFFAGTIRRCFEKNNQVAIHDPLMAQLSRHLVYLQPMPERYGKYIVREPDAGEHDDKIASRAVRDFEDFIAEHDNSPEIDLQLQVAVARKLLSALTSHAEQQWTSTEELMAHLAGIAEEPLSEQSFRAIIGKLRDSNLLIGSRPNWGYKVPTSMKDMTLFLNRQNSQLLPMIERIRRARDTVLRATNNAVDILTPPEFANLQALILAAPHWSAAAMSVPAGSNEIPEEGKSIDDRLLQMDHQRLLFPSLISTAGRDAVPPSL